MNRTFGFFAMLLFAGVLCASCGGDDETPGSGGGNEGGSRGYPSGVAVDEPLISGPVKAGIPGAVEIIGSGFDADLDYIVFGWDEGGKTRYGAPLGSDVMLVKSTRITLGIHVAQEVVGKTMKVYLDRAGFDPMPLTGDIEVVLPEVAEGYIPDPVFRARLMDAGVNPAIAPLFNELGMLSPAGAAGVETVDVAGSAVASLEGLGLFTRCSHLCAWEMSELREADLSGWKPMVGGVFVQMDRCPKLEKIVVGPTIMRLDCLDNPVLKVLDTSPARWLNNLQMFSNSGGYLPLEKADMRRLREGIFIDKDQTETKRDCDTEGEYTVMRAYAQFQFPGTCRILVDYEQLVEKRGYDGSEKSNYAAIYDAWKRGATIDVYSSRDIEKHLGTVPTYADAPAAIAADPETPDGWTPAETE